MIEDSLAIDTHSGLTDRSVTITKKVYYNDNSDYARSSLCIYYNVTKNVYRPVKIKQYMYMFKDLTRQRI